MFGKIMKYEMKSSMKLFLIIWAGLLVVALIGGFLVNSGRGVMGDNYFFIQNFSGGILNTLFILLYVALAIGIVVLSLIFIIQRFNKGLLGQEGYLMFTLPVKTRTLISGKCLSAGIVVILSVIAGLLSILLFFLPSVSGFGELKEILSAFGTMLSDYAGQYPYFIPIILLIIVYLIVAVFKFIYEVYAAISIGHLVNKHRVLMSVAAYIGIEIVQGVGATAVVDLLGKYVPFFQGDWNAGLGDPETLFIIGGVIIVDLLLILVFHIVTETILKNRLNLE